jgi:tetratricopeptide (TPR) repeat protein
MSSTARLSSRESALENYGQIAEAFSKSFQEYQVKRNWSAAVLRENQSEAFLFYTLKMEEAYCRAATGLSDELEIARQRYTDVIELFPQAPIAWLRLGQVSSKLTRYSESVQQFQRAIELADQGGPVEEFLMTSDQSKYLRENVYRLLGYAHWRIFRQGIESGSLEAGEDFLDSLVSACKVTMTGFNFANAPGDVRLLNNLVYFYNEVSELSEVQQSTLRNRLPGLGEVQGLFDKLVASVTIADEVSVELLDTIVVVGPRLERHDVALAAARRVFHLIHETRAKLGLSLRSEVAEKAGNNAYRLLFAEPVAPASL